MDDLISRSDAIGAVKEERFPIDSDYAEGFMAALDKVEWILKEWLPSAQAEIIRCKDCKYWMRAYLSISGKHGCNVMRDYTAPDDYCFKAKRKA